MAHQPAPNPRDLPGPGARMVIMVALAAIAIVATLNRSTDVVASAQPSAAATVPAPASTAPPAVDAVFDPPAPTPTTTIVAANAQPAVDPAPAAAPTTIAIEPAPPADTTEDAASEVGASADAGSDFIDTFEQQDPAWTPMTGSWEWTEGALVQTDDTGFDYITQLDTQLPETYDLTVSTQALSAELGAGVILGQPNLGSRKGAYIVDFTSGGSFLRWGQYDPESGAYTYIGGLNVGTEAADPHDLLIEVRTDTTLVHLDGTYIGAFDPIGPGTAGLVTSESSVSFDDFNIEAAG